MGRRRAVRAALGMALGALVAWAPLAAAPSAGAAASANPPAEACGPVAEVPEIGPRACKSRQTGSWVAAQACRLLAGADEPTCASIDGRPTGEAAMTAHEGSWLARALALQGRLDLDVPLSQALFPHTHNSANSSAYAPSVSNLDANQVLTLTDQLRLGMRAIEIDVHWVPQPGGDPAQGFRGVVQCHGEPVATPAGTIHAGCSVDTPLVDLLREVRAWLDQPANADQVLLLYLENALDGDPAAHAAAVSAIDATLGELVARPTPGAGCQAMPVSRTKRQLLDAGTRVLIVGNCGPGGWTDRVFDRFPSWDERGGSSFDCPGERAQVPFEDVVVRRYEDSTWLSAMAGSGSHLDAATMAAMVRCGVNLVGFDQLHPGDERLPSLVWSWRVDEPSADASGRCAALGADGRFFAEPCTAAHPVACRTASGGWAVTEATSAWAAGDEACRAAGHAGAGVPANGWDSTLLRSAADRATAPTVWLAYGQDDAGRWVTGIPAAGPPPTAEPAPGRSGDRPIPQGPPAGPSQPAEPSPSPGGPGVGHGRPIAATGPLAGLPAGLGAALVLVAAALSLAGPVRAGGRRRPWRGPGTGRRR